MFDLLTGDHNCFINKLYNYHSSWEYRRQARCLVLRKRVRAHIHLPLLSVSSQAGHGFLLEALFCRGMPTCLVFKSRLSCLLIMKPWAYP